MDFKKLLDKLTVLSGKQILKESMGTGMKNSQQRASDRDDQWALQQGAKVAEAEFSADELNVGDDGEYDTDVPYVRESKANDYFKRRKDEEGRIAGTKSPAKNKPKQTDYEKKRKEEKKVMGESTNSTYVGRETKEGTWRVFKSGQAVAVAGPFKSAEEARAWIVKTKKEDATKQTMSEASKPDFLDIDKDGDKKEPMKKAAADKKANVKESTLAELIAIMDAIIGESSKPDFLDVDKDGDKKEPMKKAAADKKKKKVAESKLAECGGMMSDQDSGMSINTSIDTRTGSKTVSVTASGNSADELMQILKLSGVGGESDSADQPSSSVKVVAIPLGMGYGGSSQSYETEQEVDETYANEPDPEIQPIDTQLRQGTDLNREKPMYKHSYRQGDNPMAMQEARELARLEKEIKEGLNSIKVKQLVAESIVGEPEYSTPGESGKGTFSATERRAKTAHQLGSHKYTVTTDEDMDGDQYHYIHDEQGKKVYADILGDITNNLGNAISSKLLQDHMQATQQWVDGMNESEQIDELSNATLNSYASKARGEANWAGGKAKSLDTWATDKEKDQFRNSNTIDPSVKYNKEATPFAKHSQKRFAGAAMADKKAGTKSSTQSTPYDWAKKGNSAVSGAVKESGHSGHRSAASAGGADSYYGRARKPNKSENGVKIFDLTPEEQSAYNKAYDANEESQDFKDWGRD